MTQVNRGPYQSRAGKKGGESRKTDLKKAKWYMDRYLATLEKASTGAAGDDGGKDRDNG